MERCKIGYGRGGGEVGEDRTCYAIRISLQFLFLPLIVTNG